MGKVVAIEHLTLDGVIQEPGRPDENGRDGFGYGGWAVTASDRAMRQVQGECMGSPWSLLVGRVTYESFASFWPNRPQPNLFTDVLDNAQKFVASTTLSGPLPWQNSTLLDGDVAAAVGKLKKDHDKTLVIFGSGVLVQSLMPHDLIDEYVLQIHPLVLGWGRRLFSGGGPPAHLRLTGTATTSTGVIIATYAPATPG